MSGKSTLFAAVFLGSGLGGTARYAMALAGARFGTGLPQLWSGVVGTFAVNLIGSALLAWLIARQGHAPIDSVAWRLGLTTGLMGGFTTYSTFNGELVELFAAGNGGQAALYAASTLVMCLAGGWLGYTIGTAS